MLVMRETRQVREVWRIIITEHQLIACALQMVAIAQRLELAIFNDYRFVNFQQAATLKAQAYAQVSTLKCQNFFYIALGIGGQMVTAPSISAK